MGCPQKVCLGGGGGGKWPIGQTQNRQGAIHNKGALDAGVHMSRVKFKKWLCRMSLSLVDPHVPCRF